MRNYYKRGDYNAICDVCGFKYKASQLKKRWDGLYVCEQDWETRHPQEFLRTKPDIQTPAWTRPEQTDTFIDITYVDTQNNDIPEGTF